MTKRIILAFAALLGSVALLAQEPTGGVKGTVVNRNGRVPVEKARLVLMNGAAEVATATSAQDGTFLIPGLPDGMYTLLIQAPDFLDSQVQVTVNDGYVKNMFNLSVTAVSQVSEVDDDSFAAFDLDADAEITLEANPLDLSEPERLRQAAEQLPRSVQERKKGGKSCTEQQ